MPEDSRLFLWGSARLFKTTSKTPALGYCKKIQDYIKNSGFGAVQEDSRLHQELRLWGSTRRCKDYIKTSCFGAVQEDSRLHLKLRLWGSARRFKDYVKNSCFEAMQKDWRLYRELRLWGNANRFKGYIIPKLQLEGAVQEYSKTTSKTPALRQYKKIQDYIKNFGFGAVHEDAKTRYIKTSCFEEVEEDPIHLKLRLWGSKRRFKDCVCFVCCVWVLSTDSTTLALRQYKMSHYLNNSYLWGTARRFKTTKCKTIQDYIILKTPALG